MRKLLLNMTGQLATLKRTRLEMLKSMLFRSTAQQLEPVEKLADSQQEFNLTVCRELEALKETLAALQGGRVDANS
ncbi:hypothetical protein SNE98_003294 [Vibrio cholerae]|uniref:hypothetical protein n=2 Tax=Vibrio cholerae TaxID=666 RepID=UPI0011D574BC|nr:hypothetical protein [Vibrio cholerae]EGR0412522.1 hypothetical protein [Vibrio cholerae]EJL6876765.1 hypothetical protein [Vibrio cholerae]EJR3664122.1 hypothetical protein [Vibrio cholerae]EKF9193506.1 hypothetical protein [Vibrio cholerae]EKF9273577.1 hypothetical protein [Vibrio cholerae]